MALPWNPSQDNVSLSTSLNYTAKALAARIIHAFSKAEQIFHLLKDPMTLWTLSMSTDCHEVGTTSRLNKNSNIK